MTDRLTPAMRGQLSAVVSMIDGLKAAIVDVQARDEAARREAEAPTRTDAMRQIAQEYGFGSQTPTLDALDLTKKPDAPPPPAPGDLLKLIDNYGEARWVAGFDKDGNHGAQTVRIAVARKELIDAIEDLRAERDALPIDARFASNSSDNLRKADAPAPPAPFVTDHKWLDPECHASGCQTLILKAELEKLKGQRDKYMWQVRDTCRRAETAEADAKRLREALEAMLTSTEEDFDGDWELIVQEARAALAQGGNDE